jgi:exodeoxyribonuclease VII small subunit
MNQENLTPVEDITYEQALLELESVVDSLENEELPLEQALILFERGQALAQRCATLLDQAELRVQQITGDQIVDFKLQS